MVLLNKKWETIAFFFLEPPELSGWVAYEGMMTSIPPPPSTAERPLKSYFLANEKGETIANFF